MDGFLGRVTKARILDAVREARGERAAARIDHLKKGEMAEQAEGLLFGSGWLPELLRTPGRATPEAVEPATTPEADRPDAAGPDTGGPEVDATEADAVSTGEAEENVAAHDQQADALDPEAPLAYAIVAE